MDNEASMDLKMTMATMTIKYQLVPPSNHRSKNSDRAIHTFKNHFIAGLYRVDKDFYLQVWERLLHQATISLNFSDNQELFPTYHPTPTYLENLITNAQRYSHQAQEYSFTIVQIIKHHGHHMEKTAGTQDQKCNTKYDIRRTPPRQEQIEYQTQQSFPQNNSTCHRCTLQIQHFMPHRT